MTHLPQPVHAQDEYAYAIVLELRAINTELQKLNAAIEGLAEKPEPESEIVALREALPTGFPGRFLLEDAGITSLPDVPRDMDSLTAISGIGKATATAILEALDDV